MAVAIATKVDALRVDFRSAARLADMLGVSRAQVTRWLRGAGIDPLNAEKVDLLELVWSNLLRLYERDAALAWLFGVNPVLGDRRPIDLIREGRTEELMRAIRAERSDRSRDPPPLLRVERARRADAERTAPSGFRGRTRAKAGTTTPTATAASTSPSARSRASSSSWRAFAASG